MTMKRMAMEMFRVRTLTRNITLKKKATFSTDVPSLQQQTTKFYVNGEWVNPIRKQKQGQEEQSSSSNSSFVTDTIDVINPSTEESIATISIGSTDDVNAAVHAATQAFYSSSSSFSSSGWGDESSFYERIEILKRTMDIYRQRSEEFAQLMSLEMGAPISFSREYQTPCGDGQLEATIQAALDQKRTQQQQQQNSYFQEHSSMRGNSILRYEPIGVCGLITPWNWPMHQVVAKVAPAIATGCTMVLKPSELAPLSSMLFAEVLHEAGCPPGVFNLINGDGKTTGSALAAHPNVDMISFTGSTVAGTDISRAAASTIKRVVLELGGKAPNILFADLVDDNNNNKKNDSQYDYSLLEQITRQSVQHCFSNSGQSCDAPTRLLVERSIYDKVIDIACHEAEKRTIVGPAQQQAQQHDIHYIGPVISQRQFDRIQQHIQNGVDEGAALISGGLGRYKPHNDDGNAVNDDLGYFVRPTIFANVTNDMSIAQEEIFGPVLVIIPFDTEEEAVAIANDTKYGLAAYINTSDRNGRGKRVANQLRAGTVSINGTVPDFDVPFGGYKQSGNGRENGLVGLAEYLEVKSITGL